ncbi:MAG: class I SAM-dependent methyltransferase [Chitinophagales bacterium]
MKRNYDTVALFYDQLARLAYSKTLINAQLYLLNAIPAGAHVLIAGGGTGWVLEELTKIHPSGLTIDYIDASPKMISLAEKRNAGNNRVTFITAPIQDMQYTPNEYDVVLTPFLFDNFTDSTLQKIFPVIDKQLSREGIWLYCDFRDTGIWWQKVLLKIMYLFFRLCCGIEASQLPDVASCFSSYHYKITGQKMFRRGFIVAAIYKRI